MKNIKSIVCAINCDSNRFSVFPSRLQFAEVFRAGVIAGDVPDSRKLCSKSNIEIRTLLGDVQGHVASRSLDRLNVFRVRIVNESESIFAITSNQKR